MERSESFSDKFSKMSEDKKLTRRKKKPHHGPSSLLRATIMEYGIYDKEVDAFKTQFVELFDFLDTWKRPNSAGDNNNTITNQDRSTSATTTAGITTTHHRDTSPQNGGRTNENNAASVQRINNGNNPNHRQLLQLDVLPFKPYGRGLSLEEELDFRLQRMTSIANDLKSSVDKEKERRAGLVTEVTDCKERALQVLTDMTLHFHRETELLQHRLLEMDAAIDDLEQEKHSMKVAYEEMVQHANRTVEAMGTDLLTAEERTKALEEETNILRTSHSSMETENSRFQREAEELHLSVKELKVKVETLDNQLQSSELSKTHYESLLDISLDKLRLLEYGEVTPRKNLLRLRQKRALLQSTSTSKTKQQPSLSGATLVPPVMFPRRSKSEESHDYQVQEAPCTTLKPRLASDSQSMTSYETGREASGGALDTSRAALGEGHLATLTRTPTLTSGNPGMPSPKTASRTKKTKKKTFFAKAFQRKNQQSVDSSLAASGSGLATPEGLPTIRDDCRDSQISLTGLNDSGETEHPAFVKSFDASLLGPQNEYQANTQECLLQQQGRSHSVDDLDSYTFLTQEDCPRAGDGGEEEEAKRTKKVQRTTSFAAIRKNGLTAFAKEVEKRFRKKRRSKTADGTEILQAKEEFESHSQKAGTGSKEY